MFCSLLLGTVVDVSVDGTKNDGFNPYVTPCD